MRVYETDLFLAHHDEDFDLLVHPSGKARVMHMDLRSFGQNVLRRMNRALSEYIAREGHPVLAVDYTDDGESETWRKRFLRLTNFQIIRDGFYDGRPCNFYARIS